MYCLFTEILVLNLTLEQAVLLKDIISDRISGINRKLSTEQRFRNGRMFKDSLRSDEKIIDLQYQLRLLNEIYDSLQVYIGRFLLARRMEYTEETETLSVL